MDVTTIANAGFSLNAYKKGQYDNNANAFASAYRYGNGMQLSNIRHTQEAVQYSGPYRALGLKYFAKAHVDKLSIVVEKPGLYALDNLFERSGFDMVLFLEEGTFSLTSIYKHAEEIGPKFVNFRTFIPTDEESAALAKVKHLEAIKFSYLGRVLPMGASSLEELQSKDLWKTIHEDILKTATLIKEEVKEEKQDDNFDWTADLYKIEDRFLPFVVTLGDNTWSYTQQGFWVTKDLATVELSKHPFEGKEKPSSSSTILSTVRGLITNYCSNGGGGHGTHGHVKTKFFMVFYDLKVHDFIISQELEHIGFNLVRDNLDKFQTLPGFESAKELYEPSRKSGLEFRDAINQYFVDNGFPKLKVTFAYPTTHSPGLQVRHYKAEEGRNEHYDNTPRTGFWIQVSYNDKKYLGINSEVAGCVSVQDDGRMSLIESSWCQRVSRWSKEKAQVIDQYNEGWRIVDWLSGPFAEMRKMEFTEAPFVFKGNVKRDDLNQRKKKILDQLKAELR